MRKQIIFMAMIAFAFIFTQNAQAQQGDFKINPGLELGVPIGDFGKATSIGFGATVKGLYNVSDDGQVELTLGYLSFSGKKVGGYKIGNYGIIPIMAGYRHNFDGFYGEGQLGLASVSYKVPSETYMGVTIGGGTYSSTEFSWALGVGYNFDNFDLSARYQAIQASGGALGWFGIRVGYNFEI